VNAAQLTTPFVTITEDALARVRTTQGTLFHKTMGIAAQKVAEDTLDPRRPQEMADVLQDYVPLAGKVLEIGSGCGVTHILWRRKYGVDAWGVEPEGEGFDDSAAIARDLIAVNGLDPTRIVNATGEALPFPDNTFDIVYSTNVLEHVNDPAQVLREAVRVLKPGGTMQIVVPNYLSYFDGHYAVFHPPIFSNTFFCWWVKNIYGKDPSFAATIRTQVNPAWVRRQLRAIQGTTPLRIHTLGEAKFLERMTNVDVGRWMALDVLGRLVKFAKALRLNRLAARIVIALQGWNPLIITATKL